MYLKFHHVTIEIIKQFYSYAQENGFQKLKESKVVRPRGADPIFNMSAISEHISLFKIPSETGCVEKYVTKNLSCFSNKLDGVGKSSSRTFTGFILNENQIQTTSTLPCRTQVQPAASFLVS